MKKIALILLACIGLLLVACGQTTEGGQDTNKDNISVNDETEKQSETIKEDEESEIEWYYTHKVPGHEIVIDAPNYQNIELGYTELYIIHESKYVSVTAGIPEDGMDLLRVHELAYSEFLLNINNYNFGELTITDEEYVTINGIDMYRYEGTIAVQNETESHEGYAMGYSFIMDGVPCTVGGAVLEVEQSEETIKEIHDTVEAMIRTLRSER